MSYIYQKLLSGTLALLFILTIVPGTALAAKTSYKDIVTQSRRITIILVIDGLQQNHLKTAKVPNIKGLMKRGTTVQKVADVPDGISDIVSALLTGTSGTKKETLAEFYSSQRKNGIKTIFIDGTGGKLESVTQGASIVNRGPFHEADKIMTAALKKINPSKNFFCIIVLSQFKEKNSRSYDKYGQVMSIADNQVGLLLNHLRNLNILSDTHIAITGTTGDPPIILNGPKIQSGLKIPIATCADVAATLSFLNNQSRYGTGMVLYEAIEPDTTHSRSYLLEQRVKELSDAYARAINQIEQMLNEYEEVKRQQNELDNEKARFRKIIEKQQKEINKLKLKITLFKLAGYMALLIFAAALYIEYRYLKKRFMFFL